MFSQYIGKICRAILDIIVRTVSALKIHPNYLTLIGFLTTILAAFQLAKGKFLNAGMVIIVAGIFDMLDGRVARITNNVTRFGAFFDSVLGSLFRYRDLSRSHGLLFQRAEDFIRHSLWGCHDGLSNDELYSGPCRVTYPFMQSRIHGTPGTTRPSYHWYAR